MLLVALFGFVNVGHTQSRPSIHSEGFVTTKGELKLKVYGVDFKLLTYRPQLYFDDQVVIVDSFTDTFLVTVIDLPIVVGTHQIYIKLGNIKSNVRTLSFTDVMKVKIDNDRELLNLTPIKWLGQMNVIVVDQPIAPEVPVLAPTKDLKQPVIVEEMTPELPFSDLNQTPWVVPYLTRLFAKGFIKGYGDGTFRPNAFVSRIEALKMMMDGLGVYTDFEFNDKSFVDVPSTSWMYPYAQMAKGLNILVGPNNKYFKPNYPITRFELLLALFNLEESYYGRQYYRDERFEFIDLDSVKNNIVSMAVNMEIIARTEKFRPNDFLTRAEWTKILDLFLQWRDFPAFISRKF